MIAKKKRMEAIIAPKTVFRDTSTVDANSTNLILL
jgi:hypothetical protein